MSAWVVLWTGGLKMLYMDFFLGRMFRRFITRRSRVHHGSDLYVDSQVRGQRTFNNLMFGSCRVERELQMGAFKAPLGSECTPA